MDVLEERYTICARITDVAHVAYENCWGPACEYPFFVGSEKAFSLKMLIESIFGVKCKDEVK